MWVDVKAYLLGTGGSVQEVRRFELNTDDSFCPASPFMTLSSKLRSLFVLPDFKMCYKDEEGDLVTFSSHDEMRFALTCVKDGIFRIYIITSTSPELHLNAT
ncbi:sequestosome-1-like [Symphorus nematophorus]